jgi:hypothetical protein
LSTTDNARLAGITFLLYIAAGVSGMAGLSGALASVVLSLAMCFSALVLAVTLFALTRGVDRDLARLAMFCRVGEGILGAAFMGLRLGLRSLETADASPADAAAAHALSALVRAARSYNVMIGAMFFAVGSLLFCWLLLRGRLIPASLAWIGVAASLLLAAMLPLQMAGMAGAPITTYMWLPMLVFELGAALWLIVKGVPTPARLNAAA